MLVEADGSSRPVFPVEARLRKITYAAAMKLNMSVHIDGVQREEFTAYIGNIPIMLKSKQCHLSKLNREELIEHGEDPDDQGGYFIINGSERVLVSVEDLAPNRMIVSKETKGGKHLVVGRIFSVKGGFRAKIELERKDDGLTYISFPASPKNLNIFIVLKALGFDTKAKMIKAFSEKPEVLNDIL
ncbi:MAG: DNA-directed RNA polymerase subunit B, partial [Candidatus Woesearchaeota archaeon]|nr:DNA-directed RNA polymerase subunit B [Candidatus Woesearchaeota archaeon]